MSLGSVDNTAETQVNPGLTNPDCGTTMGQTINYTVSVGEATTGIWIFLRLLPQKRGDTIRWSAGYVAVKA